MTDDVSREQYTSKRKIRRVEIERRVSTKTGAPKPRNSPGARRLEALRRKKRDESD